MYFLTLSHFEVFSELYSVCIWGERITCIHACNLYTITEEFNTVNTNKFIYIFFSFWTNAVRDFLKNTKLMS